MVLGEDITESQCTAWYLGIIVAVAKIAKGINSGFGCPALESVRDGRFDKAISVHSEEEIRREENATASGIEG